MGRLNKATNGLVQSSCCWNLKLAGNLKEMGFEQSHADHCVCQKLHAGEIEAILVVHVDNLFALTTTSEMMEYFVKEVGTRCKVPLHKVPLHKVPHHPKPQEAKTEIRPTSVSSNDHPQIGHR